MEEFRSDAWLAYYLLVGYFNLCVVFIQSVSFNSHPELLTWICVTSFFSFTLLSCTFYGLDKKALSFLQIVQQIPVLSFLHWLPLNFRIKLSKLYMGKLLTRFEICRSVIVESSGHLVRGSLCSRLPFQNFGGGLGLSDSCTQFVKCSSHVFTLHW